MSWNLADIYEQCGLALGDDAALIHGDHRVSWADLDRRTNALGRFMLERGAKAGDKVAIYSYNRTEWLEAALAAFKARLVPVNVNYRYRDEELAYLLENSDAVVLVYEGGFSPTVDRLRAELPLLKTLIHLDDGEPMLDDAVSFEEAAGGDGSALGNDRSPDDLMFLYTGGTTGMPKGVMWRQEDVWLTLGGGGDPVGAGPAPKSFEEHMDNVRAGVQRQRLLAGCPLMHGTGWFTAINALGNGGSIVTLPGKSFDAHVLWETVEREEVNVISIVGDVFSRPMLKALNEKSYDLSSLRLIISSGVMWSKEIKQALLEKHPYMVLFDSLGSSEATGLGASIVGAGMEHRTGKFQIGGRVKVFTDEGKEVQPGSGERGLVARSGPIPLGYYKDPKKSAEVFRTYDGVRYSMPGDYATVDEDGSIQLLGRGSQCINTGGEKVFPEEVEEILKRHDGVVDAAVVGLPDERWGQAITALVVGDANTGADELKSHVRDHLAGYKTPKQIFFVESLGRSPSGKMDYKGVTRQARALVGLE